MSATVNGRRANFSNFVIFLLQERGGKLLYIFPNENNSCKNSSSNAKSRELAN